MQTVSWQTTIGGIVRLLGRLLAIAGVILVWLPAYVFVAGLTVTALTGCRVTEAGPQACLVAGTDIGHDLYGMLMMGWVVIALLPLMLATITATVAWGAIRFLRVRRRASRVATARAQDGPAPSSRRVRPSS